ncbi:MAG: hypothetical protein ABIO70_22355 [Pseudomonadota bacterium]
MSGRRLWIAVFVVTAVHAAVGVADLLLMLWVVPEFGRLFAELGGTLPVATRLVLAVADGASTFWWLLPPLGLVALALDAGLHAWVGRRLGLGACLGLGALVTSAQLLAPALGMLGLYLPMFLLADAVRL